MRRDIRDYDDIPDLNSNDSYAENLYDDHELLKNDLDIEEEDDYYIQFINPQNTVARSHRESHPSRYDYLRDLESPFTQSIRVPQRKNVSPQWHTESNEKNLREINDTNVQSGERKKRTKILSRTNRSFNRETGTFSKNKRMLRIRDDL